MPGCTTFPGSTARAIRVPSTGARITVSSSFACATPRFARACASAVCASAKSLPAGRLVCDLQLCRAQLALRDVQVALRVIERRLADEALRLELLGSLVLLARLREVRLRLDQRLLRRGQAHLAQLAQPRLGLGNGAARLRNRGALVLVVELDQDVAALDALAFLHRYAHDAPGDHRSDRHPLRRDDPSACHHGLHEIAARCLVGCDRFAEDQIAQKKARHREHERDEQAALDPAAQESETFSGCHQGLIMLPAGAAPRLMQINEEKPGQT